MGRGKLFDSNSLVICTMRLNPEHIHSCGSAELHLPTVMLLQVWVIWQLVESRISTRKYETDVSLYVLIERVRDFIIA